VAIELKNALIWKASIDAIASFLSEGNFRFSDSGIKFRAIDPSQVLLVNYVMDKAGFDKYDVEPNFVGLDIAELAKIMSRTQANDKLVMDLNDSELSLTLQGEFERSFKLPLIDVPDEDVSIPEHEFDAKVEINARLLKESLKDASLFGSSVVFRVEGKDFFLDAKGSAGSLNISSKASKKCKVTANGKKVESKYSLSFLQNIAKEADPETMVTLELKTDTPLKISYEIGKNPIQYHLAHMIL